MYLATPTILQKSLPRKSVSGHRLSKQFISGQPHGQARNKIAAEAPSSVLVPFSFVDRNNRHRGVAIAFNPFVSLYIWIFDCWLLPAQSSQNFCNHLLMYNGVLVFSIQRSFLNVGQAVRCAQFLYPGTDAAAILQFNGRQGRGLRKWHVCRPVKPPSQRQQRRSMATANCRPRKEGSRTAYWILCYM